MDLSTFKNSLEETGPPSDLSVYLLALWYDAKGHWNQAHDVVQDLTDKNAAWIHAYLHRKEGDNGNADYWYRRADKSRAAVSLDEEWEDIVSALITTSSDVV